MIYAARTIASRSSLTRRSIPALALWVAMMGASFPAWGSIDKTSLADRLTRLRGQVLRLEQGLIENLNNQGQAKGNLARIRQLMELQRLESELGQKRMSELEKTIATLESRRTLLKQRVGEHRRQLRQSLSSLSRALRVPPSASSHLPEGERLNAPRRKALANQIAREMREIEALRVDLADADQLEARIAEEREQLAYLFQDLKEKEGVLELNRQLQADLLARRHQERASRLESYRKLKTAEAQVEQLIGDFNARIELEKTMESERAASISMRRGGFPQLKGRLELPVPGAVVSSFARHYDEQSRLHVFKKGIDISVTGKQQVRAVAPGKIAYAGVLPNYGKVAIVDHGAHYYTLCANLGSTARGVGDAVAAGDSIGESIGDGTPVYFEIRSRNVAVNPLQWLGGSFTLTGYGDRGE